MKTNNEKIAQWLGWKYCGGRLSMKDGVTMIGEGDLCHTWLPDEEIALWHEEHGLLDIIQRNGLARIFTRKLSQEVNEIGIAMAIIGNTTLGEMWDHLWCLVNYSASQAANALAKMIDDEGGE